MNVKIAEIGGRSWRVIYNCSNSSENCVKEHSGSQPRVINSRGKAWSLEELTAKTISVRTV